MPYEEETAGVAGERLAMARDGDWSGSWNWKSGFSTSAGPGRYVCCR